MTLEVSNCDALRGLIASSAAKHPVQLMRLSITEVFAEPHKLLLGDHAFSSPYLEEKKAILRTWRAAMDTRRTTLIPLYISCSRRWLVLIPKAYFLTSAAVCLYVNSELRRQMPYRFPVAGMTVIFAMSILLALQ
ncbi:hypothetical protein SADUNF_Sadunf13G0016100 [Salix dunnii]|uniref:Uncharacterized protein n=1 Tax=Salix dunnii TaxID=1413687 RepID=A0A835JEW5_9ROSI|nr:hypothetical protein SADUNF_Sadunf13G0016100 [Salix dunnii]